jgi:hypothetical protein
MIHDEKIHGLTWQFSTPSVKQIERHVPIDFLNKCPNIVSDNKVDIELLDAIRDTPLFNQIKAWSSQSFSQLYSSPGIVLLKLPENNLEDNKLKSLYYIICCGLGKLNTRYGEMFEVKDRNLDYKKEAIPVSKTSSTTGFHTDSTSFEYSPDFVGLLCLQPAKTGGESILANAANLFLWLKKNHPENVPVLLNNIIRDVITPGSKTDTKAIMKNRFPIFSYKENVFKFRYMRYWIISGHERCKQLVKKELIVALNQIDEYLNKKENSLQFRMERGDILLINNNFICHNRSEYEDYEAPIKPRTLIRTWINNPTNLH